MSVQLCDRLTIKALYMESVLFDSPSYIDLVWTFPYYPTSPTKKAILRLLKG